MTDIEESYIHFSCCLEWLNESWNLLQKIKEDRHNPLVGPVFRFALVMYAKPYGKSRGQYSRKYRLDNMFVPSEHINLHEEIISERDQLHAHSDLTVMDARLIVHAFEEQPIPQISQNKINLTRLLFRLDDVIALVEGTLDRMYVEVKNRELNLPLTAA